MQTLSLADFLSSKPEHSVNQMLGVLEKLPPLHRGGPWLVGGTVRRFLIDEPISSDLDFMFRNEQQFKDFCAAILERGCDIISESDNQITYDYLGYEIQAIKATFDNTLIQTLNKFDFTICQFGFDGTNLVWGEHSMDHLESGRLVPTQIEDPVASMRRAFKYTQQGFYMSTEDIANFLKQATTEKITKAEKKWLNFGITVHNNDIQSYGELPMNELQNCILEMIKEDHLVLRGLVQQDKFASGGVIKRSSWGLARGPRSYGI